MADVTLDAIRKAAAEAVAKAVAEGKNADISAREAAEAASKRAAADANIDNMNRTEFGNHMFSRIVDEVVKHIQTSFENLNKSYEGRFAALDLMQAEKQVGVAAKDPDFEPFKELLSQKLSKRPELSPAEALAIVKSENPDKVKELSDARVRAETEKLEAEKPKFGGMFPTSSTATADVSNMDSKAAADAAWQTAFKNVPSSVFSGEPAN